VFDGGGDRSTGIDNGTFRISGAWGDAATRDNDTGFISGQDGNMNTTIALNAVHPPGANINPDAAAAWCDDGSAGGALWLAISADNISGFTLSKWSDNATVAADYVGLFSISDISTTNGADNTSSDNITSLSMTCDPDDFMPVIAVGYDDVVGEVTVAVVLSNLATDTSPTTSS
jgi:hypothetical protein